MSNNEAKFVLHVYRPNGSDAQDPALADALAQARQDPQLAAWFAKERAHAAAVAAKLREINPPPELREAILAGARASKPARPRVPRVPFWMGIAASIALLAVVGVTVAKRSGPTEQALADWAIADAREHFRHRGEGDLKTALQRELSSAATRLGSGVAIDFAALAKSGCRAVRVRGRDVLEVCFVRDGVVFHCYIGKAPDFRGPVDGAPRFFERGKEVAAAWARGGFRYVLVTDSGAAAITAVL